MLRIVLRRAPERHDRVADELVQRAAVAKDDFHLQAEVAIQQADDLFRRALFRQRGEAAYVGKQHGDFARLAAQRLRRFALGDQRTDHARIEKAVEDAHRLFARFFLAQVFAERGGKIESPAEQQRGQHCNGVQPRHRKVLHGQQHQAQQQQCAAYPEHIEAAQHKQRHLHDDQQQRDQRREISRCGMQVTLILQVVQRGGQDLHAGILAGYRGGADVVQAGGGGADDDDLAGQFVRIALRLLARLVGI